MSSKSVEFKQLSLKAEREIILQLDTDIQQVVDMGFLVSFTRPTVNIDIIRSSVQKQYAKELAESMMVDEVRLQIEKEVTLRYENSVKLIAKMPQPFLFAAKTIEFKKKSVNIMSMKIAVSNNVAHYIIDNNEYLITPDYSPNMEDVNVSKMIMQFHELPLGASSETRKSEAMAIIEKFAVDYDDAIIDELIENLFTS